MPPDEPITAARAALLLIDLTAPGQHQQEHGDEDRESLVDHPLLHQRLRLGRVELACALSHSDEPPHEDVNGGSGRNGYQEDQEDLHRIASSRTESNSGTALATIRAVPPRMTNQPGSETASVT